jgi:hypothetical protein
MTYGPFGRRPCGAPQAIYPCGRRSMPRVVRPGVAKSRNSLPAQGPSKDSGGFIGELEVTTFLVFVIAAVLDGGFHFYLLLAGGDFFG